MCSGCRLSVYVTNEFVLMQTSTGKIKTLPDQGNQLQAMLSADFRPGEMSVTLFSYKSYLR